jgi:glycine/D-amino acid oxidase-like deaminating enzyme
VCRVAIIGTGALGACVGYYLAREGADVLLVDAGHPGALTTSASLAWVNASSKAGHPAYFDLNFAGLREYECLAAELADAAWWNQTGHLRWDYRDARELTAVVEQLRARGYPAEVWEAEQARRRLEPHVVFGSALGLVALFPSEGWVDGPRMVHALVQAAVRQGATTAFGSAVRTITVTDGTVASIELGNGEAYAVDRIVNAAGPAAPSVAALVGRALPMRDSPGLAVRVEAGEEWVRRVIHAPDIAIRPDGAGRAFLLARRAESALRKAEPASTKVIEQVGRLAARVVPELAGAAVADVRVGHRPIPVDGLPVIGKASDVDGYYEAITHSGITLGPIVGRALTAEILNDQIDPLVSSFRASRLPSPSHSTAER